MKPKIGEVVYTLYFDQIYKELVGYLGADSFICEGYVDSYDSVFYYEDYNKDWFRDLEKAKKALIKKYHNKVTVEQIDTDVWEACEKESY